MVSLGSVIGTLDCPGQKMNVRTELSPWLSTAYFKFFHSFLTTNYATYIYTHTYIYIYIIYYTQADENSGNREKLHKSYQTDKIQATSNSLHWYISFHSHFGYFPYISFHFLTWQAHKFSCRYFFL